MKSILNFRASVGLVFVSLFSLSSLFLSLLLVSSNSHAGALDTYLPQGCYHSGQYQQNKTLKDMTKPLVTEGSFAFNCNYGLIWHTQLPIVETAIYKTQGDYFILAKDTAPKKLDNRIYRALGKLLNNLIGGNNEYLQQNFTIDERVNSVVLTPKNKQMKKFLQTLTISSLDKGIKLHLDVADQETLDIQIFSQKSLESFEQNQCEQLADLQPKSCELLFKGLKP